MANTFGNEFFILVDPDWTEVFEETEISPALDMTADVLEGPFTVTGATNAGPIVITTSVSHGLLTGRAVSVTGVGGNLGANVFATIVVLSANTFYLSNINGTGAYTSGGIVTVANDVVGHSISLGEVILERDVLATNSGVVGGGDTSGRVSYAF